MALDGLEASSSRGVFVTEAARELVALPVTEETQPIHYHSLIVEKGGEIHRFREMVVMYAAPTASRILCSAAVAYKHGSPAVRCLRRHGDYIYPEYIVAYKRVPRAAGSPGAILAATTGRQRVARAPEPAPAGFDSGLRLPPSSKAPQLSSRVVPSGKQSYREGGGR